MNHLIYMPKQETDCMYFESIRKILQRQFFSPTSLEIKASKNFSMITFSPNLHQGIGRHVIDIL